MLKILNFSQINFKIAEFWLEMNFKHNFTQANLTILKICHFFTIFSQNTMTFKIK